MFSNRLSEWFEFSGQNIDHFYNVQVGRKLTDELLNKKGKFNTELDRVIELEQDLQKTFAVTLDIRLWVSIFQ